MMFRILQQSRGEPNPMNDANTMKKTAKPPKHDWTRFDAMTEAQRHAAALKDPGAQPLRPEDMKRRKRTPQVLNHTY